MIPLMLSFVAAVLVGTIPLQLHLDTRRSWAAETEAWHGADVHELPAPRADLAAFPERVTPMDLPARHDATFAYSGPSRVREAGRHRLGVAVGRAAQQARWNTDTGQFWLIVAQMNDLDEPCSHCSAPEDGERAHFGCPGCSCPCGTAEPLPEGVDGYAIAGGTRDVG